MLALGVMLLVVGFGRSSALASAYGISVTGEMLIHDPANRDAPVEMAARRLSGARSGVRYHRCRILLANAVKVLDGGWVSIGVAAFMGLIVITWVQGSRYLFDKTRRTRSRSASSLPR